MRGLVRVLCLALLLAGELRLRHVGLRIGCLVAVMCLVVEDDDVLLRADASQHPTHHLALGLLEALEVPVRSGQHLLRGGRCAELVASQEGVEVRDHHSGRLKTLKEIVREEVALLVVVVRGVRLEDAQPITDGDAGRDDQECVAEALVLRIVELVQRLPGDDHAHHHRLASACGHLECDPIQAAALLVRLLAQQVVDPWLLLAGDLGQVDRRLERLDLAEEERLVAILVRPVAEQLARRGRDPGIVRSSPGRDMRADAVDRVVLLHPLRGPVAGKRHLFLRDAFRHLALRLRDRDEVRAAAALVDRLAGDSVLVEAEVARRLAEW